MAKQTPRKADELPSFLKVKAQKTQGNKQLFFLLIVAAFVAGIVAVIVYFATSAYFSQNTANLESQINALNSNYSNLNATYGLRISAANSNYSALKANYNKLQNSYSSIKANLSSPEIKQLFNMQVTVPSYLESYPFYNAQYGLYNNYTIAGTYNTSFNVANDGYLIIRLISISSPSGISPQTGSYGIQVYSQTLDTYYSYALSPCKYYLSGGLECNKATILGWGLYPVNSSSTYLAPVSRGLVNISLTNDNKYPITMNLSITYVGTRYSNMTPVSINYSIT